MDNNEKGQFNRVHFSSKREEWATPGNVYDELNDEFGFTLDPCATHENAKCEKYFTKDDDGLAQDWGKETVFMNPPYGRNCSYRWVEKAHDAWQKGATVVCLLPARTDTKWFHDFALKGEVRFFKGRLKFGNAKTSAPFPSILVVFKPNRDDGSEDENT